MKGAKPLQTLERKKKKAAADFCLTPWLSRGSDELGESQAVNKFTGHFTESMPWHFTAF